MAHRMTRGRFVTTATGSTFASIAVISTPAQAAQFEYKFAHGNTADASAAVRITQAVNRIRTETGGRLNITQFINGVMGSEVANIGQVRSNTIQFTISPSVALSTVVPGIAVDGLGFAWHDLKQVYDAYDGPMGDHIRGLIAAKGIHPFAKTMDIGMRNITSSTKPVRNVDDFTGFRIRIQPGPISIDLFRTLGASPTPIVYTELYLSMQNKVVDGMDAPPYQAINMSKFYEVQKYLSVTNHQPTPFFMIASEQGWNALPPDIQRIVTKNFEQAAVDQRHDTVIQSGAMADKLRRFGLTFNTADTASMRAKLKPFYERWQAQFGDTLWGLLERATGKLV
jgi:tripartite ATP-independent transporter DctP family solute receptor